jgi:hypothetical protein
VNWLKEDTDVDVRIVLPEVKLVKRELNVIQEGNK